MTHSFPPLPVLPGTVPQLHSGSATDHSHLCVYSWRGQEHHVPQTADEQAPARQLFPCPSPGAPPAGPVSEAALAWPIPGAVLSRASQLPPSLEMDHTGQAGPQVVWAPEDDFFFGCLFLSL